MMIREGKFVEDQFDLSSRGVYHKHYGTFEFQLLLAEYEIHSQQNTFLEDLKKGIEHFVVSFPFIKLGELHIIGTMFRENDDIIFNDVVLSGKGLEAVYEVLKLYNETKLFEVFNSQDPEEALVIFFALEYQSIDGEMCVNDQSESVLFTIEKKNGVNQLVCDFRWGSGAEWFYNKYQKENREIVRKAIIDFYESSPDYQELKISYYLYLFDLEIEKYTHKKVIAKKNNKVFGMNTI